MIDKTYFEQVIDFLDGIDELIEQDAGRKHVALELFVGLFRSYFRVQLPQLNCKNKNKNSPAQK